jgi:TolB-like protein/DNA-binding winged helix-turn-helix (wHTH) protein/tetratricopeptide (TPR) repeat protein
MDKREIRFDGWCVNFESGEITKGGETHRLQDQPLQILDELTQRPGQVVTREQLIARLWPKGVVEFDTGLNTAMRKLRIALGDDADTPRYIETIPRKGYRFIGVLETTAVPTVPELPSLPSQYVPTSFETGDVIGRRASDRQAPLKRLAWGFGSILVAAVLAVVAWNMPGKLFQVDPPEEKLPTIVVLPLVDMSVDQNEQSLCDGLTEELSNWLAHIPTLRVVARTSAFAFKGTNTDVREIGRQLGATHVLEGSLRRSGNQMRITVQLIEATHGLHIWSDTYDMPLGDIFLIEDTVSRAVAEQLHLTLSADTAEQWAQRQPEKMEAYELYLLGRARQRKRTADDNLKAAEFFRRAVAADPQYALAQVGLAETLLNGLSLNRAPLEDVSAEAEPLINRALSLSPNLPDALAVKGWLLTEEFKLDKALPLLQRATKANPNDASSHRFLGNLYDRRADPNSALSRFSVAAELDPLDFISHVFRCQEFIDLGELDHARQACLRARELDRNNMWGPLATSWIARAQGDTDSALRWLEEARKLAPSDEWAADQIIELLVTQKKMNQARALLPDLPGTGGLFALSREATVVLAEKGSAGLRAWMTENDLAGKATTGAELTELARLQYLAGDAIAARATLTHAQRILPLSSADLFDGSQIRHEYSASLFHAGIELQGGGDAARAQEILNQLDQMLATYEKNGGQHYGLYYLRAASLAMQGKKTEAEAALMTAWQRGWRSTWRARGDPFLGQLTLPGGR